MLFSEKGSQYINRKFGQFCSITLLKELEYHSIDHDSKVFNIFHTTKVLSIECNILLARSKSRVDDPSVTDSTCHIFLSFSVVHPLKN